MAYQFLGKLPSPVSEGAVVLDEVVSHLDGALEGCVPPQHTAPVCNALPWSYIALGIIIGTMAVGISMSRVTRWLVDVKSLNKRWALGILFVTGTIGGAMGAIAGWRIYDWWLGMLFGITGGAGFPFLLSLLEPILTRLGMMKKNGQDTRPQRGPQTDD